MASFFVIQGNDQGKRFELTEPVLALGRDHTNSIRLNDTEISRRHAEVRENGDGFFLVDLGSSNGTFVNSEPVQRKELRSGDRVQLGSTLMIFTASDDSSVQDLSHVVDIVGQRVIDRGADDIHTAIGLFDDRIVARGDVISVVARPTGKGCRHACATSLFHCGRGAAAAREKLLSNTTTKMEVS
ncbi:MAG: FHA domain-containing protein [Proteobacteria bacterium]|nr:FHA domain-containing protein [Pseudomonadota bacterium]